MYGEQPSVFEEGMSLTEMKVTTGDLLRRIGSELGFKFLFKLVSQLWTQALFNSVGPTSSAAPHYGAPAVTSLDVIDQKAYFMEMVGEPYARELELDGTSAIGLAIAEGKFEGKLN